MEEVLIVPNPARRLADSLIVGLAIFLALHQYTPTRALTLVALRRNRSSLLAKIMEGDRAARRQILARADNAEDQGPLKSSSFANQCEVRDCVRNYANFKRSTG